MKKLLKMAISTQAIALAFTLPTAAQQINKVQYAFVNGWTIESAFEQNNDFLGCDAIKENSGAQLRIGFDKNVWALGTNTSSDGDFDGTLAFDGFRETLLFNHLPNGWAMLPLSNDGLERFKKSNRLGLDVGFGYSEFSLNGSLAVTSKISECVSRRGEPVVARNTQPAAPSGSFSSQPAAPTGAPSLAQAQQPQGGAGLCSDGKPNLPGTGLCQSDARALLPNRGDDSAGSCPMGVGETAMPNGQYLIYLSEQCQGKNPLTFEYREFPNTVYGQLVHPANGPSAKPYESNKNITVGLILGTDDITLMREDGRRLMREDGNVQYADQCDIKADTDGSFRFEATGDYARQFASGDSPSEAHCGPLGPTDSLSYWRAFGGHTWFFDLGQDSADRYDPHSLTLIERNYNTWSVVK